MNWLGVGPRALQDLVAAHDGTSEPPFLRLEASSVFSCGLGWISVRQRREPVATMSGGRHQRGRCFGGWRCLYSCSTELRTK
jgi:hypothetical protein